MIELETKIATAIDLIPWTIDMRDSFSVPMEERLFEADLNEVTAIIKGLGYQAKIYQSERGLVVMDRFCSISYQCGIHVDYGHATLSPTASLNDTVVGGLTISWYNRYKKYLGESYEGYVSMPAFRNYGEMEVILCEYLKMYEKFKVAVHESDFYASPESGFNPAIDET